MYPEAINIFIIPPSFSVLEQRLRDRGTEEEEIITRRLSSAKSELAKYKQFDYIVFNDDLEQAVNSVLDIIHAEKHRISRNEDVITAYLETMPSKKK